MDSATHTAELILDAAERLFAEKGFDATTIKDIAAESRQNSALIYYYYDSKATLYRHVIERVVVRIQTEAGSRIGPSSEPQDVITGVIESQVAVLTANPHLPLLLSRELIDWKAAHAEPAIRNLAAGLFERLRQAIEEGQRAGTFDLRVNPRFAAISVIAQVAYLVLARPIAGVLLQRGLDGPTAADIREFGRHAASFALSALRPPAPATASPSHTFQATPP